MGQVGSHAWGLRVSPSEQGSVPLLFVHWFLPSAPGPPSLPASMPNPMAVVLEPVPAPPAPCPVTALRPFSGSCPFLACFRAALLLGGGVRSSAP